MSAEVCFDTNVLVYQLDTRDARKHRIAESLIKQALGNESACISFEVVQECLNTVFRKAEVRLDVADTRAWLNTVLIPLVRVVPTPALYQRGLDVRLPKISILPIPLAGVPCQHDHPVTAAAVSTAGRWTIRLIRRTWDEDNPAMPPT